MKNNIFNQTKRNIIITSIVIVLFSLVIFSIIITLFYRVNLYEDIDRELNIAAEMIKNFKQNDTITILIPNQKVTDTFLPRNTNPKMIMILYEDNHILYQSSNRYFDQSQELNLPNESSNKVFDLKYENFNFRGRIVDFNNMKFILLYNTDSERYSFVRLTEVLFFSFIILLAFSFFLSILLASKVLKPMNKSYNEQVQFVQNASHEMRTPLAIIKGKLELLAIHPNGTIEENFDLISMLMSEVYGLERLNKDLLALSKEDVDKNIIKSQFSLLELINEFSEFYGTMAEYQNKKFIIDLNEDMIINQDYHRFKQSIMILIENAFKYTNEYDSITLKFESNDKYLYIKVIDTGIGIKEQDKEFIFERFFRSDDVRGKNIEGNGIGLSLLKSLSKVLNFKINMSSIYGEGTEFTLIYKIK